jgi:hypothetical protein
MKAVRANDLSLILTILSTGFVTAAAAVGLAGAHSTTSRVVYAMFAAVTFLLMTFAAVVFIRGRRSPSAKG